MAWHIYIDAASGQLLSMADTGEPAPAGVVRLDVAGDPRDPALMYDQTTRTMVARPPKVLGDRWADLQADPTFGPIFGSLNATRKAQLQAVLIRVLGSRRYRAAGEPLEL